MVVMCVCVCVCVCVCYVVLGVLCCVGCAGGGSGVRRRSSKIQPSTEDKESVRRSNLNNDVTICTTTAVNPQHTRM